MSILQKIKDHKRVMKIEKHLQMCADIIWKPQKADKKFINTNCEITAQAAREVISKEIIEKTTQEDSSKGILEIEWVCQDKLDIRDEIFVVAFGEMGGEEHYMVVYNEFVYQSYAFVHEVIETSFDKNKQLWEQISHNKEQHADEPVYFIVPKRLGLKSIYEDNLPNITKKE